MESGYWNSKAEGLSWWDRWLREQDSNPGLYCCINPECSLDHDRDMVFNGGAGYTQ